MTSRKRMSAALYIEFPRRRTTNEWTEIFGVAKPDWIVSHGPARWHEQVSGLLVEEIARGRQGRPKIDYNAMGRHRKARNIRVLADAALDEERVDLRSLASWSVIDDCA